MDKKLQQQIATLINYYFKWLVVFVMAIILILGYFFLIRPETLVAQQESSYQKIEGEYLALKRFLTQLNELSGIYQNISAKDIEKIDKFLPKKSEIEELMKQMEVIVLQNGLFLSTLQISEGGESEEGIGRLSVVMSIVGTDYIGLKNLLYTIESNLRLLDISKLSFSHSSKSTTIDLVAYYQK